MKRRVLIVGLVCCMLLGLVPAGVVAVIDEEIVMQTARAEMPSSNSVSANIIRIRTAEELAVITSGPLSAERHYILENDIHLTHEWTPIHDFQGIFDGQGHTIHNLFVLESSNFSNVGLFGSVQNATIRNVNVRIGSQGITGIQHAGGIVGITHGSINIERTSVVGTVRAITTPITGSVYAGGLIGISAERGGTNIVISDSYTAGNIIISNQRVHNARGVAGGLVGRFAQEATISNSYSTSNITAIYGEHFGVNLGGIYGVGWHIAVPIVPSIVSTFRLSTQTITGPNHMSINHRGTVLAPDQMRSQASFVGWDFDNVWEFRAGENDGFPVLRRQSGGGSQPSDTVIILNDAFGTSGEETTITGRIYTDDREVAEAIRWSIYPRLLTTIYENRMTVRPVFTFDVDLGTLITSHFEVSVPVRALRGRFTITATAPDGTSVQTTLLVTDPNRHLSFWYHSTTVSLPPFSFNAPWQRAIERGMDYWTNSDTPIRTTTDSNSRNRIYVEARPETFLGRIYVIERADTVWTEFHIVLNTREITGNTTTSTRENFATSVMTHEIGHAVGLIDDPVDNMGNRIINSIMNRGRDRTRLIRPQPFDEQGVNLLYR